MPNQEILLLYQKIAPILRNEQDFSLVQIHWEIGRLIVDYKSSKQHNNEIVIPLLKKLASLLSQQFGNGFRHKNLHQMCSFYHAFPKREQLERELKWTHYRKLIPLPNLDIRMFYVQEIIRQQWSIRQLDYHIKANYYERMMQNKMSNATLVSPNLIRNPYMLQLLNIAYSSKKKEKG